MCNNFCILEQFKNDHNVQNNWFQFRNRVNLCCPPPLTKEFVATIIFRYSSSRVGLIFTCEFLYPVWMVRVQMAITSWSLWAMELQWNLHSKSASSVLDLRGRPLYGPKFSQFHAVFWKILAKPSWRVGAPSYGESWILWSSFNFMSISFLSFWYEKLNQFYPWVLLYLLFEATK